MCVNIFLGGKGLSHAASHKEAVGRYTLSSCLLSGWRGGDGSVDSGIVSLISP